MSRETMVIVRCDRCSNCIEVPEQSVESNMTRMGWGVLDDEDLCEDCYFDEMEELEQEEREREEAERLLNDEEDE